MGTVASVHYPSQFYVYTLYTIKMKLNTPDCRQTNRKVIFEKVCSRISLYLGGQTAFFCWCFYKSEALCSDYNEDMLCSAHSFLISQYLSTFIIQKGKDYLLWVLVCVWNWMHGVLGHPLVLYIWPFKLWTKWERELIPGELLCPGTMQVLYIHYLIYLHGDTWNRLHCPHFSDEEKRE